MRGLFRGAYFSGATFYEAHINGFFNESIIRDANLQGAVFRDAIFTDGDFARADLSDCQAIASNFSWTRLTSTTFRESLLIKSCFVGAN